MSRPSTAATPASVSTSARFAYVPLVRPKATTATATAASAHDPLRLSKINLSSAYSPYARSPYASSLLTHQKPLSSRRSIQNAKRRRNVLSHTTQLNRTTAAEPMYGSQRIGLAGAIWRDAADSTAPAAAYAHATPSRPLTARPPPQQRPLSARPASARPASARPFHPAAAPTNHIHRPSPPAVARPSPPAAPIAPPALYEIHRPRRKHHATSDFSAERTSHAVYEIAAEPVDSHSHHSHPPAFYPLLNPQPNPQHARQIKVLEAQLRNPPSPERYEATFDAEEPDDGAAAAAVNADPPAALAAPAPLSPSTAEALLGIGGGPASARRPMRPVHAAVAAVPSFLDRPLPMLHLPLSMPMPVPPPPSSPPLPEGWSAVPSPSVVDESASTRPLPFQVDWERELRLATGSASNLLGVASPPSRTASTSPRGPEQQEAEQQQQWQPAEAVATPTAEPEDVAAPRPEPTRSVVPLFILQRREREREERERRNAAAAAAAAAAFPMATTVPPLSFLSEFEQKECSAAPAAHPASARYAEMDRIAAAALKSSQQQASAASSRRPSRPSSARPASANSKRSPSVPPPTLAELLRGPPKPSAAGRDDEAAIAYFIASAPEPAQDGQNTVVSSAPFFNVRSHRGKRTPLNGR